MPHPHELLPLEVPCELGGERFTLSTLRARDYLQLEKWSIAVGKAEYRRLLDEIQTGNFPPSLSEKLQEEAYRTTVGRPQGYGTASYADYTATWRGVCDQFLLSAKSKHPELTAETVEGLIDDRSLETVNRKLWEVMGQDPADYGKASADEETNADPTNGSVTTGAASSSASSKNTAGPLQPASI